MLYNSSHLGRKARDIDKFKHGKIELGKIQFWKFYEYKQLAMTRFLEIIM